MMTAKPEATPAPTRGRCKRAADSEMMLARATHPHLPLQSESGYCDDCGNNPEAR